MTAPAPGRQPCMVLADERLTGLSAAELAALAALLAPAQAAQAAQRRYEQRGGQRRRAPGAGSRSLLTDADRVLVTVVYLRQVCSQNVLSDLLGINANSIGQAIAETRQLLTEHGRTIAPDPLRFTTANALTDLRVNQRRHPDPLPRSRTALPSSPDRNVPRRPRRHDPTRRAPPSRPQRTPPPPPPRRGTPARSPRRRLHRKRSPMTERVLATVLYQRSCAPKTSSPNCSKSADEPSATSYAKSARSSPRTATSPTPAAPRFTTATALLDSAHRPSTTHDTNQLILYRLTRSPTSLPRCRSRRTPARRRPSPRSGTPRTATTPAAPSPRSKLPTARSSARPSRRSPTISTSCSRSTTTRPSTGSTCAPPTRSSRPSPPSGTGRKITKGPGSKAAGLAMAFKLIEAAQDRWRAVNAPHLVALVRAGATFTTANSSNAKKINNQSRRQPRPRPDQDQSTGLDNCSFSSTGPTSITPTKTCTVIRPRTSRIVYPSTASITRRTRPVADVSRVFPSTPASTSFAAASTERLVREKLMVRSLCAATQPTTSQTQHLRRNSESDLPVETQAPRDSVLGAAQQAQLAGGLNVTSRFQRQHRTPTIMPGGRLCRVGRAVDGSPLICRVIWSGSPA